MSDNEWTVNDGLNRPISGNTNPSDPNSGNERRIRCNDDGKLYSTPATPVELTADGQIKATAGTLYSYKIQFVGVTAGDKVEIRDSTTAGGGTVIFTIIAITPNEVYEFTPSVGMIFSTGIYHDETKSGGTIYATYIYD